MGTSINDVRRFWPILDLPTYLSPIWSDFAWPTYLMTSDFGKPTLPPIFFFDGPDKYIITSDAHYFIVKIKCPCDFIIVFWANSYFIFQMHHAKIFKMRYSKSLYKLFWKYESWFCSEVSKTHFTKYPWNHAFAGMKKKYLNQ